MNETEYYCPKSCKLQGEKCKWSVKPKLNSEPESANHLNYCPFFSPSEPAKECPELSDGKPNCFGLYECQAYDVCQICCVRHECRMRTPISEPAKDEGLIGEITQMVYEFAQKTQRGEIIPSRNLAKQILSYLNPLIEKQKAKEILDELKKYIDIIQDDKYAVDHGIKKPEERYCTIIHLPMHWKDFESHHLSGG